MWSRMEPVEIVGYIASLLIAAAMMMRVMLRLRLVALAGSLTMALYGALIAAWPIVIANAFIAAVHVWHLRHLLFNPAHFELQPISQTSHWYFDRFIRFYAKDIARSHPGFDLKRLSDRRGFFILRDMLSAGLFVYTEEGRSLRIHLDYVTPPFRDLKNARFAYAEFDRRFANLHADRFIVTPDTDEMRAYFARVGFTPLADDPTTLARPIHPHRPDGS
jgi:hypothetical protein